MYKWIAIESKNLNRVEQWKLRFNCYVLDNV